MVFLPTLLRPVLITLILFQTNMFLQGFLHFLDFCKKLENPLKNLLVWNWILTYTPFRLEFHLISTMVMKLIPIHAFRTAVISIASQLIEKYCVFDMKFKKGHLLWGGRGSQMITGGGRGSGDGPELILRKCMIKEILNIPYISWFFKDFFLLSRISWCCLQNTSKGSCQI